MSLYLYLMYAATLSFFASCDFIRFNLYFKVAVGIASCVLCSIVLGTRDMQFGTDTVAYFNAYQNFKIGSGLFQNNFEIGYNSIILFAKVFGFDFYAFQVLVIFVISIVFFWGFFSIAGKFLFCNSILLISPFFFSLSTNIQRQGLAVAFAFLALSKIPKGRYFFAVFFAFVSINMHISAVLFFVVCLVYLVVRQSLFRYLIVSFVTFGTLFFISNNLDFILSALEPFIPRIFIFQKVLDRLEIYSQNATSAKIGVAMFLDAILLASAFLVLWFVRIIKSRGALVDLAREEVLWYAFLISSASFSLYIALQNFSIIGRVSVYGFPFLIVVLSVTLTYFKTQMSFLIAFVFAAIVSIKTGLTTQGF